MPRPAKPWWWAARGRWAATIGGVRETAPPEIGRGDEHAAWEWHRRLLSRRDAPTTDGVTIGILCEMWLEWDERRVAADERDASGHDAVARRLTQICRADVGGRPLGTVAIRDARPAHLEAAMRCWATAGLSANYRRSLAFSAKEVLRWATKPGMDRGPLLDSSPFAHVKIPPAPPVPPRYATRDEAATWLRWLWREGMREYALLQRCLIHSGARPAELAMATWGEIDWRGHRDGAGHWMAIVTRAAWKCRRKTGKFRRIYLPAGVCRALRRRRGKPGEAIWLSPRGLPFRSLSPYTTKVRRRAIAAGVPIKDTGPDRMVNYRWRHTAASSLCQSNVPVPVIAELLGTSVQQIMRTYAHILDEHLGGAAEMLAGRRDGRS